MDMMHKIFEVPPAIPSYTDTFMFCEKCGCPAMVTSIWINKIGEHKYNLCCGHVVKVEVKFESYEVIE